MVTRTWKVYGANGKEQEESFYKSYKYDFSDDKGTRILEVDNYDKTGTHDYSIVRITRNTYIDCETELEGQLYDGIFENEEFGSVMEIFE